MKKAGERTLNHISNIDEWVKEMQNTINLLKEAGVDETDIKGSGVDSDDNDSGWINTEWLF